MASFVTLKVVVPAGAPLVAVAVIEVDDEVALTDCQVALVGASAVDVNAAAAVFSAVNLVFTAWYAEMTPFCLLTCCLRLVCG